MSNINRINISNPLGNVNQNRFSGQGQNVDFKSLLQQNIENKQSEVVFSKHAMQRVNDRQIDLSNNTLNKLNDAVSMAKAKGVRDALILNGDSMFIVNTASNTVVTALKGNEMKENVFTNIDGTVIM